MITTLAAFARWRRSWLYEPNERTVHTTPMPAIGGLAMYVGFLVALLTARLLDRFDPLFARNSEPAVSSLAATFIIAVGLFDDVKGLVGAGQGDGNGRRRADPRRTSA